jgi:bile acid:Na+ symporter, BASS family
MIFVDILLKVALVLIMFNIGLSLKFKNFQKIFKKPKKLSIGLISQIILLPLLAFLIVELSGLPVALKMGIILLASCPGGTSSNFVSYLIKADVPLSVSLTSVNALITLFSIPLIINFFLNFYYGSSQYIRLPFFNTFFNLFFIILIPLILGILVKEKNEKGAYSLEKYLKIISIIALAGVFAIKFFASETGGGSGISFESAFAIFPVLIIFHILSLLMGFFNSKLFKINNKSSITTSIEVGLQNTGLALLIGGSILKNNLMIQPALVYGVFSFFTTLIYGVLMKKYLSERGRKIEIKGIIKRGIEKMKFKIKKRINKNSKDFYNTKFNQ